MKNNIYSEVLNTRVTPQSEQAPGTVANSAGGYSFAVDCWKRLDRFLILGSEGGTYYIRERDLTLESAKAVRECLAADPARTIKRIVEISDAGRAPKNDPALAALAIAAASEVPAVRAAALSALPKVARTGTHLFHFLTYVQGMRGWGRGLRNGIASWYTDRSDFSLANQLLKYQSRDGWSHADAIKLAHPKPSNPVQNALFKLAVSGELPDLETESAAYLWAQRAVELLHTQDKARAIELITTHRMPRELVPTQFMTDADVLAALLPHMGYTALIRNLANLTRHGVLAPLSDASKLVTAMLADEKSIKESRVHPLTLFTAYQMYRSGSNQASAYGYGQRDLHRWTPVQPVVSALEAAFYASFGNVEPSGKRHLLAVDVSGSMRTSLIAGMPHVSAHIGAAVMAMVTARKEPNYHILGFHHGLVDLGITSSDSLELAISKTNRNNNGGTDCAVPILWALKNKVPVETFVVYTDSETWAGKIHPYQALRQYREKTGIPARLAVVGMTSNGFSLADPSDAGMLDVVGFDTATPTILSEFAKGNL